MIQTVIWSLSYGTCSYYPYIPSHQTHLTIAHHIKLGFDRIRFGISWHNQTCIYLELLLPSHWFPNVRMVLVILPCVRHQLPLFTLGLHVKAQCILHCSISAQMAAIWAKYLAQWFTISINLPPATYSWMVWPKLWHGYFYQRCIESTSCQISATRLVSVAMLCPHSPLHIHVWLKPQFQMLQLGKSAPYDENFYRKSARNILKLFPKSAIKIYLVQQLGSFECCIW